MKGTRHQGNEGGRANRALLAVTLVAVAWGGCGLYRADADLDEAARVLPRKYPGGKGAEAAAGDVADRYWRAFGSPVLNRLVSTALAHNHDLLAAAARVRQAGFGARVAWSGRFPGVDVSAGVGYSASGSDAVGQRSSSGWTFQLGVAASYELDLFGRTRAVHSGKLAEFQAARWDLLAARMTLAAEVTLRWLAIRAAGAQLALLRSQDAVVARTARVLEQRFRQGSAPLSDLLAQRQTRSNIEAQRALVMQQRDAAVAELRLLLGSSGADPSRVTGSTLPELPPLAGPGLPARLVKRRPDVQAAWHELVAAAWEATAARADRLPRLNLSGSFALSAANPADLFSGWVASALAGLAGPLFHFFERKAAAQQAEAAADEAKEELKQALLEAFRDVELALTANRHLQARAAALRAEVSLAEERVARLTGRFLSGTGTYLDLYVAELARIKAQRALLTVRAGLLAQRVQLARALGGGWQATKTERSDPGAGGGS